MRRMPLAPTLWTLGYLVVGVALATALAWPVYQSPRLLLVAAAGLVLGVGVVLAARLLRWKTWATILIAAGVYLVAVAPLAVPGSLSSPSRLLNGVLDGIVGVATGWKQLLTLTLPVGEYQAVLVPFLVTVYVGSLLAAVLGLSGSRFSGLAAPVVVLMAAFGPVFGSSTTSAPAQIGALTIPAPRELLLGMAVLVVTLVWIVGRARMRRTSALRAAQASTGVVRQRSESLPLVLRRNALGVGLVVVAVVAGVAITPVAADLGPRQALRDGIDPLLVVRSQTSPLSQYRAGFEEGAYERELFTVNAGSGVERLRIATLDVYDGAEFHVSGARGENGRFIRLPRSADGGTPVDVTIGEGYDAVWMPVPAGLDAAPDFTGPRADELADGFYVSEETSSAIEVAGADEGDPGLRAGDGYRVMAGPDAGDAELAASGTDPLLEPESHPALVDWLELQELPETGAGLLQAIELLRERGYLSHALTEADAPWVADLTERAPYAFQPSYSGHSTARVEELFADLTEQQQKAGDDTDASRLVSAAGDDEQFAVAAALLARYFGYESRVVVGVRLATDDDELGVPACAEVCTGGNVSAWIEVQAADGGWRTVDTTPQFTVAPQIIAEGEQLPENPTIPDEVRSELLDPPAAQRDDTEAETSEESDDENPLAQVLPVVRLVGLIALGLLLLVLPALVLAFAKQVRRRSRRDAKSSEAAIVGAWAELVDGYVDHGVEVPVGTTRRLAALELARPGASALAASVDRAVFSEHPPGRGTALAAWQIVDTERKALRAESGVWRRIRAMLNPASFLRALRPGARPDRGKGSR